MKLALKNVGIIAEAQIALNGLTVITGVNNSGKTTVGRTIYAMTAAVENLHQNALFDKISYTRIYFSNLFENLAPLDGNMFLNWRDFIKTFNLPVTLDHLMDFIGEAEQIFAEAELKDFETYLSRFKFKEELLNKMFQVFQKQKPEIAKKLASLRETLQKDPQNIDYAAKRMEKKLNTVFFGQLTPLTAKVENQTECRIFCDHKTFVSVNLNEDIPGKRYHYNEIPFHNAFFIDDSSVVDELTENRVAIEDGEVRGSRVNWNATFLNSLAVQGCKNDLIRALLQNPKTITDELAIEAQTKPILEEISKAVAYGIEWRENRYVSSDLHIDLRNLAQGAKAFLVIKILIANGALTKNSLLVLDEPENHLHPEWQKLLADTLVLLVKHLECRILLTTHSADFVMALDVASHKYGLLPKCTFYIARKLENDLVTFDHVNEKYGDVTMNDVYYHLSKSFMSLEPERQKYVSEQEEKYLE